MWRTPLPCPPSLQVLVPVLHLFALEELILASAAPDLRVEPSAVRSHAQINPQAVIGWVPTCLRGASRLALLVRQVQHLGFDPLDRRRLAFQLGACAAPPPTPLPPRLAFAAPR